MTRRIGTILSSLILFSMVSVLLADQEVSPKPEDWDRRLEMLRSVPYLDVSESPMDMEGQGVVWHDSERAYQGYNLYCRRRSGDIFLLNMDGGVVHQWVCSRFAPKGGYHDAHMLENGDLLVIRENHRLLRTNWNSELIWEKKISAHHDLATLPDGSFYVIANQTEKYRGLNVWFDVILHLTRDGEVLDRWNTYQHLDEIKEALNTRLFLDTILDSIEAGSSQREGIFDDLKRTLRKPSGKKIDYFHLNAISLLPATPLGEHDPRFGEGNLLVCFRNVNQMAILEKGTYRILWSWGDGELEWPHQPTMLPNGHILVFDNGVERKFSRVLEIDALEGEIIWAYMAQEPEDFYTSAGGSIQRLPNGNTLICETNKGRVFEVDQESEIVWVWLNPASWLGQRETVYRMRRLPKEMVEPLLQGQQTR